jgi:hypothetical protein
VAVTRGAVKDRPAGPRCREGQLISELFHLLLGEDDSDAGYPPPRPAAAGRGGRYRFVGFSSASGSQDRASESRVVHSLRALRIELPPGGEEGGSEAGWPPLPDDLNIRSAGRPGPARPPGTADIPRQMSRIRTVHAARAPPRRGSSLLYAPHSLGSILWGSCGILRSPQNAPQWPRERAPSLRRERSGSLGHCVRAAESLETLSPARGLSLT